MTGFNINTLNSFIQGRNGEVRNLVSEKDRARQPILNRGNAVNAVKLANRPKENEMPTRS